MASRTADEDRSLWEAFITAPENAHLLKRYAKSANEPAPLLEHIGEDLASSSLEVREQAFRALTAILHDLYRAPVGEADLEQQRKLENAKAAWASEQERKRQAGKKLGLGHPQNPVVLGKGAEERGITKPLRNQLGSNVNKGGRYYDPFQKLFVRPRSSLTSESIGNPRYVDPRIMERDREKLEIKTLKTVAISRFTNSVEALVSSPDLSTQEIADILSKTTSHAQDIFQAAQQHIPFEETVQQKAQSLQQKGNIFVHQPKPEGGEQSLDLSEIPKWRGRQKDGKPLDFIQTHYGQWLSAFGAEEDVIFQDQIRKHDPKLLQDVITQLRWEGQGRKIKDLVKPRSARTDQEYERIDSTTLKHAARLSAAKRRRQSYKARKAPKPPLE